jgi:hypothetical protein
VKSEIIWPPSSGFLRVTGFKSLVSVEQPLHREILFMVEEHCLLEIFRGGINYRCLLGYFICSSIENGYFVEHIDSIIRFLRVIGFLRCVIVKSLLISLSIEVYYLWANNTVFWDALTAVTVTDAF